MAAFGRGMGTVQRIAVLEESACARARAELHALRDRWCRRRAALPFFTLGAAAYLDAQRGTAAYDERAALDGSLLRECFGWVHERVAAALAEALGGPVRVAHEHAPPGFHLYQSHPAFERPIAEVHFDLQQHRLDWGDPERVDWTRPISFTLPVALPQRGGGLHTWDISYAEITALDRTARRDLFRGAARTHHPYRLGEMVMHSGHLLHQAAPGIELRDEDERFTLQGHALRRDGVWDLYW